ncbi:ATPase AAA-type core [Penicillium taxi]|uniref:ATPase AAA-type core n=1 Tax=Penicillium taxi TaxID=168475 RepID=UPI0025455941|nr:ATPase AAA-type core [Penicillium taxi]KAJ5908097.1 ATPase AAA-type core [Penicillium taxi]
MNFSSPQFLTSFDPALELHSDIVNTANPPSESCFDDDLEAIHTERQQQTRNKVVIQHRAWNLSDVFRSDDEIGPITPTKAAVQTPRTTTRTPTQSLVFLPSSPPITRMPFIASPGAMAHATSNDDPQKRKAVEADENSWQVEPKRQRMLGGFVDDDDDEDDDIAALRDEQLKNQFELQEYIGPEPADIHDLERPKITTDISQTADSTSQIVPTFQWEAASRPAPRKVQIKTCSGRTHQIPIKKAQAPVSYERLIASRSEVTQGRATKSYYGIEIHKMLDDVSREAKATTSTPRPPVQPSVENPERDVRQKKSDGMMWTEKYRARKFTDLIGDERTHRAVLRWMKGWEPIVFPGLARSKTKNHGLGNDQEDDSEERMHRKVLLLSGPPGLGKTTLAHVCAKQAGYEVLEINASDDRSKDVVKGRIRDALGTENIKGSNVEIGEKKVRRAARPVCVIVDEVDGVVGGSGSGGEGGFMKALVDLVLLDQRNSNRSAENGGKGGKKRKGDNFRFLRPLIMVCNDLYHPSLRPLRAASIAEMINVRQAPMENMVQRVKDIFVREGIPCDGDGARRLCEASWGLVSKRQRSSKNSGSAEGDIRSVLVAGEWVAHKLRNEFSSSARLTRNWLEQRVLSASTEGSSFFKEMSRGGVREIVNRVFTDGGGFDTPTGMSFKDQFGGANDRLPVGVADLRKRHAINRLREMVDASGEHDKCINDCFAAYPIQQFQDDNYLSKPGAAYDWLHFHDTVSHKVHASQEWELGPYLSQSVLAFHHLFASARGKIEAPERAEDDDTEEHPFSGPRADFAAFEAQKQNRAILNGFHTSFSAPMTRLFRSGDNVTTELIPHLVRMLSPDVKPVIVRGQGDQRSTASVRKESERVLVQSAVRVMAGMGVTFEKVRVEHEGGSHGGWAYRMEPPIDELVAFSQAGSTLASTSSSAPVRYAVRQVLDQEYRKEIKRKQSDHMSTASGIPHGKVADGRDVVQKALGEGVVKRDFFGRVIDEPTPVNGSEDRQIDDTSKAGRKVWVTYHEGFSNAVRKPISMNELLVGL